LGSLDCGIERWSDFNLRLAADGLSQPHGVTFGASRSRPRSFIDDATSSPHHRRSPGSRFRSGALSRLVRGVSRPGCPRHAGREQNYIFERRFGARFQIEAEARTAFDGAPNSFDGVSFAGKLDVWHSAKALAITTIGLEATPPLGRQDRWEVEPFLAFGWSPHEVVTIQGQIVGRWEE